MTIIKLCDGCKNILDDDNLYTLGISLQKAKKYLNAFGNDNYEYIKLKTQSILLCKECSDKVLNICKNFEVVKSGELKEV